MQDQYIILAPLMLQIVGLTLAVIIDPYIKNQDRKIMLIITGLVFSLVIQNYVDYISDISSIFLTKTEASSCSGDLRE